MAGWAGVRENRYSHHRLHIGPEQQCSAGETKVLLEVLARDLS